MRNNTMHMAFEGGLVVKLHAKDVEIATSTYGNLRKDQVTMGRVHVLDLLTT